MVDKRKISMEFRFYSRAQVAIITTLLFISAFLMFSIQPLTGKTLLPQFGGVPAVWNTCMVFFQALLLIGYTYVFLLNKTRSFLTQAVLHLGLIGITCFYLPINLTLENEYHGDLSAIWLFIGLFLKIGAPLFIISSTAPILQMWFARTRHKDAEDPYYLYVASNFGSMAALLLYPLLIEHYLTLNEQRLYWTIGYVLLAILVLVAAIVQARLQIQDLTPEVDGAGYIPKEFQVYTSQQQLSGLNSEGGIGIRQRLLWVASACVPSSVLLGVSTHITTDIAPIPMLWVIPLGIYLLTFILAFARKQLLAQERLIFLHTMALAAYLLLYKDFNMMSVPESILIHLFILFTSAYICHQTLVRYRPTAKHLPDFTYA